MKHLSPLTAFFLLILLSLPLHAQEETFDDEEAEEEVDDTLASTTDEALLIHLSPDERWLYGLRSRLDHVLQSHRTTQVTVRSGRKGKGRKGGRSRTVTRSYRVGMTVYDLTADSTIFRYNDTQLYIPASNQKLFVSIAALSALSPYFHFQTDIFVDGAARSAYQPVAFDTVSGLPTDSVERPFLKGNLYVQGGFDPTLDKQAVNFVACKFMAMALDSIDGKVYCYEPQKSLLSDASESWFWQRHPSKTFSQSLYGALMENGTTFSQSSAWGTLSSPHETDAQLLTTLSTPISAVLRRMMKLSDNYYAESMLLNLCDLRDTERWTYEACKQKVREMVARAGGRPDEYVISDGSGLSHANRTTPRTVVDILRYAYAHKTVFDALWESLPIAGVDGTLGSRMRGTAAHNNVRAKTGTVRGVSTLSGYLTASNGHFLAFSILVNEVGSSQTGRHLQDLLCVEMAK
ncbi:MAG: D-alanyl-D-alanine carboxypeptidase/D-alanyl-D-alanine-endopeptidase [Bacteroidales bacterium]|nr:D-alanyl-D-alanine carboxypeptidase/D-alanyl-D-alanine-endopeptidase [Candidatus Physcousia equi]